MKEYQSNR